jgi:hypothetical protein
MNNIDTILMGIEAASKILDLPLPKVYFARGMEFPNPEISSIYKHKDNEIFLNEDWVLKSNHPELMVTAFHETRHVYQHFCIKTNSRENQETINTWKKEFDHYISPSGKNDSLSDLNYLKQAIEIDAIAFAYFQLKEIFNMNVKIPKEIKELVLLQTPMMDKFNISINFQVK